MFFFLEFDDSSASASYDKGILFEGLVRELVDGLGYKDIDLRVKKAGKEYDIRATAKLGARPLMGQAKALNANITSAVASEFVGSLELEEFTDDTVGLFVSISDLTPDAREFFEKIKKSKRERIVTIIGDQIFTRLEEIGYASKENIKKRAENMFRHKGGDTYLLVSNRGNYFVQLLVRQGETRPKAFCVMDRIGTLISEVAFGKVLTQQIPELKELQFLTQPGDFSSSLDQAPGPIGPGAEGAHWFEYKLPAPPRFFIGRTAQLEKFESYLSEVRSEQTGIKTYQVLSPSGVGKSSFLIKLHSTLRSGDCSTFVDARNFRSSLDILALLQDFLTNCKDTIGVPAIVPTDIASVVQELANVSRTLAKQDSLGVIFIDQFESLFSKPELYERLLDVILSANHNANRIVFCLARRNDQPTTYDDKAELNLSRLTSTSMSVELKDFSYAEASELLSHISEVIGQPLKPKLKLLCLEFAASGFPWLCKRVGAHIRDAIRTKRMSQDELIETGISPDELFEEDLAELDIMHREFLKDLAKYLPATLDDLSMIFEGNRLTTSLKRYQDLRLVRLIGRTYDTYNDVFKEYLRTGQIPLATKYVFRFAPSTTRKTLEVILSNECKSVRDLEHVSKLRSGTIQNVLRELRMLGLVETSRTSLSVDQEAVAAFEKGSEALNSLLRDRVWQRNGLVRDVVNKLATKGQVNTQELVSYLKDGLPALQVSESSWNNYAKTFAGWLRFVGLIRQDQWVREPVHGPTWRRSSQDGENIFLPSVYVTAISNAMLNFRQTKHLERKMLDNDVAHDCIALGLLVPDESSRNVVLTDLGRVFIENDTMRPRIFRDFLLSLNYIAAYLARIEVHSEYHVDTLQATIGDIPFTYETWLWRSKVLANWLEFAGLVVRTEGNVIKSRQTSMFDTDPLPTEIEAVGNE